MSVEINMKRVDSTSAARVYLANTHTFAQASAQAKNATGKFIALPEAMSLYAGLVGIVVIATQLLAHV